MRNIFIFIGLCYSFNTFSQIGNKTFNFGFENSPFSKYRFPEGWFQWGSGFLLQADTIKKHSGKQSMRLEVNGKKLDDSFGCIAYSIPSNFHCDSITVKVYMKYENIENGNVGLLLRLDGESGILAFENMEKENIQGSSDWKQFKVTLPYPSNARMIYVGGILSGNGKLWVDDFEVLIDNIDINKIEVSKKLDAQSDLDTEFDYDSKIKSFNVDSTTINNLHIVGRIWGFLKYYHPAIRSGNFNWDYELFRILSKIIAVKDNYERNSILLSWISSLGEINLGIEKNDTINKYINPNFNWITNNNLGYDLEQSLFKIVNAKRDNESYYVDLQIGVGNPIFKNEKSYPSVRFPDCGYRLLCLFRYWNMIEYYYPYKNLIGENWEDAMKIFIPKFISTSSELEYKINTLHLIASIHDTHANILGYDKTLVNFRGNNFGNLKIKFIENKAVVCGFYIDSLGLETGITKGDVITKIDTEDIHQIVKRKLYITPASNYETQLRDISFDLFRTSDSLLKIEYIQEGIVKTTEISCVRGNVLNNIRKSQKIDTCYKIISDNISYLYPESLSPGYLDKLLPKIQNTKGLVIDLRCYPSEFIVFSLGEFLLPDEKPFVKFARGSIYKPGQFSFTDPLTIGKKNKTYFKGKVVILIDEMTQSQAEYTAMALRVAPKAKVIGSTTAGADGNISEINLPGGIKTAISGIGVFYPDGRPTQRIGILPDIEVKKTIYGVKMGKDEALERAISEILKK